MKCCICEADTISTIQAHDREVQEFMARLPQDQGGAAGLNGNANGGGGGTQLPQQAQEDDHNWAAGSHGYVLSELLLLPLSKDVPRITTTP